MHFKRLRGTFSKAIAGLERAARNEGAQALAGEGRADEIPGRLGPWHAMLDLGSRTCLERNESSRSALTSASLLEPSASYSSILKSVSSSSAMQYIDLIVIDAPVLFVKNGMKSLASIVSGSATEK